MAGATKTTADAALKEDYQPLVREQINNDIKILTYVEKNTKDVNGRRAVLSLHVTRNSGIGSRAELGALPTAGAQGYAEERISLKSHYGRGQITGQLMRAADSDKGAFERVVDMENKRLVNDLKRDVNRQVWGTSNGVIAEVGQTTNSVVVNLRSTTSDVQFRQLETGMVVDLGTVSSPTATLSAVTISSTGGSDGAYTVTLSSAATTTFGTYIFRSGNGGDADNSSQKEVTGLQTIVDSSGTLFNVSPTTYPVWKASEFGNSGTNRQISENLMAQVVQDININSGTWPNLAVCHHGVFRAYANLLLGQKRFNDTQKLKGGYEAGIPFIGGGGNVIPVVPERDCPANSMFFLNTDHLTEYMASDWEFMQEDGAVLSRVAGYDAYEFVLFKEMEVGTDQRNTHGKLTDITHG